MDWRVEHRQGPAAELLAVPEPDTRLVRLLEVTRPALVLGSSQPASDVDDDAVAAAGVDVVHRRSGGGAVLLVPGEALWLDVFIPAGDEHWNADIGRAFHWLGRAWSEALGRVEVGVATRWHDGPMISTPWSKTVCFAGVGPGEVLAGTRKVVGLSQRRTRHHARFQCCALLRWDPGALVGLLTGPPPEGAPDLETVAAGIGMDRGEALRRAVVEVITEMRAG